MMASEPDTETIGIALKLTLIYVLLAEMTRIFISG